MIILIMIAVIIVCLNDLGIADLFIISEKDFRERYVIQEMIIFFFFLFFKVITCTAWIIKPIEACLHCFTHIII